MTLIPLNKLPEAKGIPYSTDHLDRLIREGKFPRPVFLSPRKRAFVEDEIDEWLAARLKQRDGAGA